MFVPPFVRTKPRWPYTGRISPPPLPRPLNATPGPRLDFAFAAGPALLELPALLSAGVATTARGAGGPRAPTAPALPDATRCA
eukprot:3188413-Alexandrium_andersonii.AAC.1